MTFCLLALATGGILAMWAPVGQFVVGLLVTAIAGSVFALTRGLPLGPTAGWSFALFACAQIGYGLGVTAMVLRRMRHDRLASIGGKSSPTHPFLPGSFPK